MIVTELGMTIDDMLVHESNAYAPMNVTVLGMTTESMLVHE